MSKNFLLHHHSAFFLVISNINFSDKLLHILLELRLDVAKADELSVFGLSVIVVFSGENRLALVQVFSHVLDEAFEEVEVQVDQVEERFVYYFQAVVVVEFVVKGEVDEGADEDSLQKNFL